MKRGLALLIAASAAANAQDAVKLRDALEWTVAQRGRMAQMTNPVVRVHGTAGLAAVVCAEDRSQATGLFRDAIAGLHSVPQSAFVDKGTTILPAASFTGLWKFVVPAALKCDPGLADEAANPRDKQRMEEERRGANATLRRAWGLIDPTNVLDKQDDNDRAAQLANAALDAGDPDVLDYPLLTRFLSQLRERAPDLSDDLFDRALEFAMSATVPDPGALQELAKYLFTSPKSVDKPDADQAGENFQVSGATIEVLTATRSDANPDEIQALIDAVLRLLQLPAAMNRNPAVAYALASQLIARARDLAPEKVNDLENGVAALESGVGAAQIQSRLGASENPDPGRGDPAYRDFWLTGRIRGALSAGRIAQARELLSRVSDLDTRAQLAELIKFAEACSAIDQHSDQAMMLANGLRGGIKRALLYASVMAGSSMADAALQVLPLAERDVMPLPAEHRIRLLAALSAALLKTDPQTAMSTLDLLVKAYNDVYTSPRRGRFEPKAGRLIYNRDPRVDTSTDSSLILAGARGMYEAVQNERGRHNFVLKAPGVTALNIANVLSAGGSVDPGQLEAAILGLRDENTRAAALVRLGAVRIRTAKAARQ